MGQVSQAWHQRYLSPTTEPVRQSQWLLFQVARLLAHLLITSMLHWLNHSLCRANWGSSVRFVKHIGRLKFFRSESKCFLEGILNRWVYNTYIYLIIYNLLNNILYYSTPPNLTAISNNRWPLHRKMDTSFFSSFSWYKRHPSSSPKLLALRHSSSAIPIPTATLHLHQPRVPSCCGTGVWYSLNILTLVRFGAKLECHRAVPPRSHREWKMLEKYVHQTIKCVFYLGNFNQEHCGNMTENITIQNTSIVLLNLM